MTNLLVTVVDQNGSKFAASSVEDAVTRSEDYAKPGDMFRIYVVDNDNPYPGYIAGWVECDDAGTVATVPE